MNDIKQKIKNTTLLSDEDKIAILAAVDGYEASDIQAFEKIIDDFDRAHEKAVVEYKSAVTATLDGIVAKQNPQDQTRMKGAADQIKSGVDMLVS